MKCELFRESEAGTLFVVTEEYNPRYDKRTMRWTCNCDDFALQGWLHPCVHIERAKKLMEVICGKKKRS